MQMHTDIPIVVTTLTPVHIGSGDAWSSNVEYVYSGGKVYKLDSEKILEYLGAGAIDNWVAAISKGESLLNKFQPLKKLEQQGQLENIADLVLDYKGGWVEPGKKAIRAHIRAGNGSLYIPGSSIKGAIRTALFAEWIKKQQNLSGEKLQIDGRGLSLSNKAFQDGGEIVTNIMRHLHVGDVIFGIQKSNVLASVLANNLSEDNNDDRSHYDSQKDTLVEAIQPRINSLETRIKIADIGIRLASKNGAPFNEHYQRKRDMLELMSSREKLFGVINKHTRSLIDREIKRLSGQMDGFDDANGSYIKNLESIRKYQDTNTDIKENRACILPVGWGVGFRIMTGDWQDEKLSPRQISILNQVARPNRSKNSYAENRFLLPKTRRMTSSCLPWGFIKLSYYKKES